MADAGAIKMLVALLSEDHDVARRKAAGAIAAIAAGSTDNQDAVDRNKGIGKLVGLLAQVGAAHCGRALGPRIVAAHCGHALGPRMWRPFCRECLLTSYRPS